eukprot:Skav203393  [mRNA]  locus=scaffold3093:50309:57639:- [translate_table: standard]
MAQFRAATLAAALGSSAARGSGLTFANLFSIIMSAPKQVQMDSIDESKVIVYSACFLCYNGLIPEFNNIGCAVHETFLCLDYEACLKPGQGLLKMPDGIGICCGCCAVKLIPITTCIKAQSQFFCCVSAAALPPDGEAQEDVQRYEDDASSVLLLVVGSQQSGKAN